MSDHDPLPEGLRDVGPASPTCHPLKVRPVYQLETILALLSSLGGWEQTLEDRADLTVARAALEDVRERLRQKMKEAS